MRLQGHVFHISKFFIVIVSLALVIVSGTAPSLAATQPSRNYPSDKFQRNWYRNPVIPSNAADPSIIRALDGYYYLYATTARLGTNAALHIFPIWRSTDLVRWTYVQDAFTQVPDWVDSADALWAPDVQYFNGRYYLYFTADKTKALPRYGNPDGVSTIGVATAPTPLGPWTDAGPSGGGSFQHGPIVPPSWGWCTDPTSAGCYNWEFDSFVYTGPDGQRWLYEGSFFGGNRLRKLSADGLSLTSDPAIQFGHNIRYEASSIVPREVNGKFYYYMLNSTSDCCAGANSPYSVVANRSTTPNGPFTDQNGAQMEWSYGPVHQYKPGDAPWDSPIWWNLADEGGGYPVLKQNGNRVVGPGGQAVIKDVTGQDWLVYHGIDQQNPWANNGPSGDTSPLRQLYIDRMDWTADGWPIVNNGNGPTWKGKGAAVNTSDGPRFDGNAPVTTPLLGDNFNQGNTGAPNFRGPVSARWKTVSGTWQQGSNPAVGGYQQQTNTTGMSLSVTQNAPKTNASGSIVQCDLRASGQSAQGSYGCATFVTNNGNSKQSSYVAATIDRAQNQLVLAQYSNDQVTGTPAAVALPSNFVATDWNRLVMTYDPAASTLAATVENEGGNPLADAHMSLPNTLNSGQIALLTNGTAADFDNVTVAERARSVAQPETAPAMGTLDTTRSDNFGNRLGSQWSWLRENSQLRGFAPTGALSLTSNGNLDEWQRLNANASNPPDLPPTQNILLQTAPSGDYMIETKMHFDPQTSNLEAGLIAYSDDDTNVINGIAWNAMLTQVVSIRNMLSPLPGTVQSCSLSAPMSGANVAVKQYTRELCPPQSEHTSQEYPASLACCWAGMGQGPSGSYQGGNLDPSRITVWVRLYRRGDVYTPWFSLDNKTWTRENAWSLKPSSSAFPIKIGVFAQNNQQVTATGAQSWFDYFRVYTQP